MRFLDLLKLLELAGRGFNSSVRTAQIIKTFLQSQQFLFRAAIVQHVFTNELSEILDVLDAHRLVENGHGRSIAQIRIHEQHGLEFLMIGSERIEGNETTLFDNPPNVVDVAELVKIFLDGKFPLLNDVNLFNLSARQTPKHLGDGNVAFVSLVVKPRMQHGVGLSRFAQCFLATLTGGRIMNFGIGSQNVITLVSFPAARLARSHVVVAHAIGHEKGEKSIDYGRFARTVSPRHHGSPSIGTHGIHFVVKGSPIQKRQFVQTVTGCRFVRRKFQFQLRLKHLLPPFRRRFQANASLFDPALRQVFQVATWP